MRPETDSPTIRQYCAIVRTTCAPPVLNAGNSDSCVPTLVSNWSAESPVIDLRQRQARRRCNRADAHPPRGFMKPRPARCQLVELRRGHHAGRSSATFIPVQRTQRGADIIDQACRGHRGPVPLGTYAVRQSPSSVYKHSTAMAYRADHRTQFEDPGHGSGGYLLPRNFLTAKRRPLTYRTAFKPCQPP